MPKLYLDVVYIFVCVYKYIYLFNIFICISICIAKYVVNSMTKRLHDLISRLLDECINNLEDREVRGGWIGRGGGERNGRAIGRAGGGRGE